MAPSGTTISVAITTHNGELFIVDQLNSIIRGRRLPDQIVISDDASSDSTVSLVTQFMDLARVEFPALDFRLIKNHTPLGVTKNFEQAIRATSGQLIALCDQDDLWAATHLEALAAPFAARSGLLMVHSNARLVDEMGIPLGRTLFGTLGIARATLDRIQAGHALEILLQRNVVTGATAMLSRRLFEIADPFPDSWLHDEWLAIVAAFQDGLDVIDESLTDYRQHCSNQVGVQAMTIQAKIGRLRLPGADRNNLLLVRAEALVDRGDQWVGRAEYQTSFRKKLIHERMRSGLPIARHRRIIPVAHALMTGRYAAFGRGMADAARDLLQPLGAAR